MPIYEYACHDCGREFETLVRSGTVPAWPAMPLHAVGQAPVGLRDAASAPEAAPPMSGPCGSCGHPEDPGSCALH